MIGYLQGTVFSSNNASMIILVSGVGYKVLTPLSTLVNAIPSEHIALYIHTHVREDQITLYGFKNEDELFTFEKLTSVSGIGPKSALAMLSLHSPSSLSNAIEENDVETLSHTPGIGKRTAEKIIIELKGKLSHLVGDHKDESKDEARLALEALGYSPKEITSALKDIVSTGKSSSVIIKEALKQLQ